jgi:hypothetical protein
MPGVDPHSGSKVWKAADREVVKPGENRGKVIAHRDSQPTAAFHNRENRRNLGSRLWAADVQPILSTKSYRKSRRDPDGLPQPEPFLTEESVRILPLMDQSTKRTSEDRREQPRDLTSIIELRSGMPGQMLDQAE